MNDRPVSGIADLAELVDLLGALGESPSGEDDGMSALDHGLQCAFELSHARPDDAGLHVAGLVHDIGHELGPDELHGTLGADRIRGLLGERIAGLVEAHVPAKRWLVASDPAYRSALSGTSVRTLERQGGPLPPTEARRFERSACFSDAVTLRRADDAAKVPGRDVPGLDHWMAALGLVVVRPRTGDGPA